MPAAKREARDCRQRRTTRRARVVVVEREAFLPEPALERYEALDLLRRSSDAMGMGQATAGARGAIFLVAGLLAVANSTLTGNQTGEFTSGVGGLGGGGIVVYEADDGRRDFLHAAQHEGVRSVQRATPAHHDQ